MLLLPLFAALAASSPTPTPEPDEQEDTQASSALVNLHQWGAVTLFHGLPSDRVRAIAQDPDGAMWFGTDAGLARYDGRRTQTVVAEGLSARRILALATDDEGTLWVGTDEGALVRPANGDFHPVAGTQGKSVTAIAAPAARRAVLATDDGLLLECRRAADDSLSVETVTERLTPAAASTTPRSKPLELTSLVVRGETVFVGTRGRGTLVVERGEVRDVPVRPRAFFVEALAESASGEVVLGAQTTPADSGLYRLEESLDPRTLEPLRASRVAGGATGAVTALRFHQNGDLFVGTDAQGVFRYRDGQRLEHFTFAGTAGALRSDRIYSIFTDREGVAWFGTDRGVCRYDPHGPRVESLSPDAGSNFVRALYRTRDGRLLCGTNRGLFVHDEKTEAWRGVAGLEDKTVFAVKEDAEGRLLVGTTSGLYTLRSVEPLGDAQTVNRKVSAEAETFEETREEAAKESGEIVAAGSVRAVALLGGATYVATEGGGVERLDEGGARRALVWPAGAGGEAGRAPEVVSLYADEARGRLWIGTAARGVFFFDGERVSSDPALAALGASPVWGLSGSGTGGWLWLATGHGLYAYKPGGVPVEIAPGLDVRDVVATDASSASAGEAAEAWCATSGGGVLRVSLDGEFGVITSRLDAEKGFPSQSTFAVLPIRDESETGHAALLVGTARGLVRYEPGSVAPTLAPARVTASRPRQLEELREGLKLEYPQTSLVLDVAATGSRTFPEQFQYAFLLYDAAGQIIKRKLSHESQFQADNLPAGRYRVVARAYTIDLVASAPFAFEFEVARAPFPWTTASLSVLLALSLVALLWGYVQHKQTVRAGTELMEANRQLAAARLQLANEAESERRRIARDLHDQTLADLRRLLLLADEAQEAVGSNGSNGSNGDHAEHGRRETLDPTVLRAEIESISHEVRRICEDLSPSVLENVGFTAALEWALAERVAHLPADSKFAYEFVCDEGLEERLDFAPGVQMQIYRIVQEAVSNVSRHAQATRVRLTVGVEGDGDFVVTLEDNGRGFDPQDKRARKGRGLAGIRARATIIDAEVKWSRRRAEEGGGMVFQLRKAVSARDGHGRDAHAALASARNASV
ncbi:MAG TPA: two-component regulator propeller domain-containing protein [Pyrinomonadaceae bacterium]|nr:two-component regulator propeller domain-containing protein [Pyrinomonadaceae bacterium]